MPSNTIVVDVVQDGQTRFGRLIDVELGVIGLRDLLVSGLAPWVVAPSLWNSVGGLDLFAGRRPEPSEDILGLQIGSALAALEVAQTTGRPDVWHIVRLDQTEDQVVLLLGLEGHQVRAVFAAQITGVQPVDLAAGQSGNVTAEEQVLAAVLEFPWSWL